MIIGVNGYSGSGKDTIGVIIQYLQTNSPLNISIEEACANYSEYEEMLDELSGWEIRKFAGKLKDIASHLTGIDREHFENQDFKKTVLAPEWNQSRISLVDGVISSEEYPMTVRDLLQKLGTECMRNGLHTNTWVNALMVDYECVPADRAPNGWDCDNWIITDTRFPNEAQAIKDKGGIIIRVDRPGIQPINTHPSETGLDHWKFDYKLVNNSDIFDLKESVRSILNHAKLL